jgi:hypothetical protein
MKRLLLPSFLFLTLSLSLNAQDHSIAHTLFLIGDAGEPFVKSSPIGGVLRSKVGRLDSLATVIYLGDNLYQKGLGPNGDANRKAGEEVLMTQASWISGLRAKGIFIPGNHDWQKGGKRGYEFVLNQGAFIDSLEQENVRFQPQNACPGPVEIPLGDAAMLVILDTQWLLHPWEKPGEGSGCEAKTNAEVYTLLEDVFRRNADKRVIVAAHHPPITYGEHNGAGSLKEHVFPLTQVNNNLYLPLPGIGTINLLYRGLIGNIQDTAHPLYREMSRSIREIMKKYPGSIYAAGHEHVLEYIVKDSSHFIVSGSGSKTTYIRKRKSVPLIEAVTGFVEVTIFKNSGVVIKYWQVDHTYPDGHLLFTDSLPVQKRFHRTDDASASNSFPETVRVKASDLYHASALKQKLFGANYRDEWATEIEVPVIRIGEEKGGLKPLQKGGGMQTLSLRLEDKSGHEYVLRSIEKYPENAVPEMFRKTFAQDVVQDQISAAHPYAALVIAGLADASEIYHTNPKLVYIPDDPKLGEYRHEFANRLALFEERPAGDWSSEAYFGNSKKIINTSKVIEKLQKDNDNQVDQQFVLKSRLFDLVIGDWDRHDDQWRWATFESKKKELYRPIPRDRDQAFFVNDGMVSKMWSRKWTLPKFEGFDEYINWPSGFSFNARYFDRSFLNGLSKDDWIRSAHDLQKNLTDSAIEKSIQSWPDEIYKIHGDRIIRHIKARRDNLLESTLSHYKFLAREVDVVGSDNPELIHVDRMENGDVVVEMFKINKSGEQGDSFYRRHFLETETNEIRIYAMGGDDVVNLTGNESKITIRVIGGDGSDKINDASRSSARTIFYDVEGQGEITAGHVRDRRSSDASVNLYDRKAFKYDRLAPLLFGNYNPDDGVFVGGGFLYVTQGFRKTPFKNRHLFLATIAPLTQSYNFRYQGRYNQVLGKWNLELDLNLRAPNYVNNFFGMGNESVFDRDADEKHDRDNAIDYYRFRFEEFLVEASFSKQIGRSGHFRIGPVYQRIEVEEPDDEARYVDDVFAPTLGYDLYEQWNSYAGLGFQYTLEKKNDPLFTSRGVSLGFTGKTLAGLDANASDFGALEGYLALYQSFRVPARVVFALRVGGGHNFGTTEFYQSQILDGRTELRGFRKTRFYGDSKLFTNVELRMKLASFRSYLFPASFGLLAFHDGGRVWYEDASGSDPSVLDGASEVWHTSFGGGLWFTPFNLTVLSIEAAHGKEGTLGYVRFGFLF